MAERQLRPRKSTRLAETISKTARRPQRPTNSVPPWAATLGPPPPFNSQERNIIVQQLDQDRALLLSLDQKGKRRGKALRETIDRIDHNSAIIAPIRLLPPEVLSYIFCFAVPEAAQFPSKELLAIVQTSQLWRQVALHTSALWTCINFFMDSLRTKNFLAADTISPLDYLNDWFSHSGRLLLSIASVGHGMSLPVDLFEAILGQLHRIRRLALLHCSSTYIKRFFSMGSAGFNIRQLDLGAGCEEVINSSTYNGLGVSDGGWGTLNFPNLETVFLHSLPVDVMLHIRAPNLRFLSFARCWTCPFALHGVSHLFPKLTHLKMMSFSLHQHDGHVISSPSNPLGIPLSFPELTHFLWLDSRAPGNPHITPFSSENVNLQALSLSPKLKYGWIEVRVPTFLRGAILPHLIDLRLQVEFDVHPELARRLFSGLDHLKQLSIERTRFAGAPTKINGIIAALSMSRVDLSDHDAIINTPPDKPKLLLAPSSPPICPKLERLTISECLFCSTELLRFAVIRRHPPEAIQLPPRAILTKTGEVTYSRTSVPATNTLPCRITLRGCPGVPNVERQSFETLALLLQPWQSEQTNNNNGRPSDPNLTPDRRFLVSMMDA